jgi:hypothetical protein
VPSILTTGLASCHISDLRCLLHWAGVKKWLIHIYWHMGVLIELE